MIWADKIAAVTYAALCVVLLLFFARGDMDGIGGLFSAVAWSGAWLAFPLWIVLRLLDYLFVPRYRGGA